jgi:hypothetical protein
MFSNHSLFLINFVLKVSIYVCITTADRLG